MRPVTVMYEDQRGPRTGFGLHRLVEHCVYDDIDHDYYRVSQLLDGRPMKGDSKLRRACQEIDLIAPDGRQVVAVFDGDQVRELLGLPAEADDAAIEDKIASECPAPERLAVFILRDNMETMIQAAAECDDNATADIIERARGKELVARDILLNGAAQGKSSTVRKCIRKMVPSFDELVAFLSAQLAPAF